MRYIGGIPDGEIVKPYLGELEHCFQKTIVDAQSPTDGSVKLTRYVWTRSVRRVCVNFSKTKQAIVITLKTYPYYIQDDPVHIYHNDGWKSVYRAAVPVADPNGTEKSVKIIKRLMDQHSSIQDFWA